MRTLCCAMLCLAAVLLTRPSEAAAQTLDGVMDFLHKLSGPQFLGPGLTLSVREWDAPLAVRFTAIHRWSIDEEEEVDPDDSDITMQSYQLSGEYIAAVPVSLIAGVAFHRFGGDADGFWHRSYPLQAELRIPDLGWFRLRPGVGIHIFPAFEPTDFAPLLVDVSRDGTEYVLTVSLSIQLVRF